RDGAAREGGSDKRGDGGGDRRSYSRSRRSSDGRLCRSGSDGRGREWQGASLPVGACGGLQAGIQGRPGTHPLPAAAVPGAAREGGGGRGEGLRGERRTP